MNSVTRATALAAMVVAATAAAATSASAATPHQPAPVGRTLAVSGPTPAPGAKPSGPAAAPVDPGADALKAFDAMALGYGNDSNSGRTIGTIAAVAIGCGLGAITGGTLTMFVSAGTLTPLGAFGGCVIGGAALGFWGSTLGGAITGLPALANGAQQGYGLLHSDGLVAQRLPLTSR